jgi:hypothetical protein
MHHVIFIGLAVFFADTHLLDLWRRSFCLFPAVRIIINAEMVLFYNVLKKMRLTSESIISLKSFGLYFSTHGIKVLWC